MNELNAMVWKIRCKARGLPALEEIVVHADELWENNGKQFQDKANQALERRPTTLLVHIAACRQMKLTAVTTLLRVRRDARRRGAEVRVRPSNRAMTAHMQALGLGRMLASYRD